MKSLSRSWRNVTGSARVKYTYLTKRLLNVKMNPKPEYAQDLMKNECQIYVTFWKFKSYQSLAQVWMIQRYEEGTFPAINQWRFLHQTGSAVHLQSQQNSRDH